MQTYGVVFQPFAGWAVCGNAADDGQESEQRQPSHPRASNSGDTACTSHSPTASGPPSSNCDGGDSEA